MFLDSFENEFPVIFSGALAHIDTLHVDWHLLADWQVRGTLNNNSGENLYKKAAKYRKKVKIS